MGTYISSFKAVVFSPWHITLWLFVTGAVFSAAIWLPNSSLILFMMQTTVPFSQKFLWLFTLYGGITTNFTTMAAVSTISIAILSGLQVVLLLQFIRQHQVSRKQAGAIGVASIGGVIAGAFGVGCAACGTFILTTLLTLIGASGLLLLLPLQGQEFGLLGVVLLLYSIHLTLKQLTQGKVCPI